LPLGLVHVISPTSPSAGVAMRVTLGEVKIGDEE